MFFHHDRFMCDRVSLLTHTQYYCVEKNLMLSYLAFYHGPRYMGFMIISLSPFEEKLIKHIHTYKITSTRKERGEEEKKGGEVERRGSRSLGRVADQMK